MSTLFKKLLDLRPYDIQLIQAGSEYCNQFPPPVAQHVQDVRAIVDRQKDHQQRQAQQLSQDDTTSQADSQQPKVDYRSLDVLPDIAAMLQHPQKDLVKLLPRVIVDRPVPSLDVHLDTQFKLLRSDILMGIEEGVLFARRRFLQQDGERSRAMRIFVDATCGGFSFTNEGGIVFRWRIPLDTRNFRQRPRWERILMQGNFVVVTTAEALRHPQAPQSKFYRGTVFRRALSRSEMEQHVSFDHYIEKGEFDIAFDDQFDPDMAQHQHDKYVILETHTFALPYFQVLKAISSTSAETLPRDIADALMTGHTRPPEYILAKTKLDLKGVLALKPNENSVVDILAEDSLRNVCEEWTHELEEAGRLPKGVHCCDPTQLHALQHAFGHNVAVVQGTPGTGKTFVGAKLAHLLYRNFPDVRVLLLCFTNHALDSFIQGVLAVAPEARSHICRMGGRCSEDLRDLQLHIPKYRGRGSSWEVEETLKETTLQLSKKCERLARGVLEPSDYRTLNDLYLIPAELQGELAQQQAQLENAKRDNDRERTITEKEMDSLEDKIKEVTHAAGIQISKELARQRLNSSIKHANERLTGLQQEVVELDGFLQSCEGVAPSQGLVQEVREEIARLRGYLQSGNLEKEEIESVQTEILESEHFEQALSRRITLESLIPSAQQEALSAKQQLESFDQKTAELDHYEAQHSELYRKYRRKKEDSEKLKAQLDKLPFERWRVEKGQCTVEVPSVTFVPDSQPLGDNDEIADADADAEAEAFLADQEMEQREGIIGAPAMNEDEARQEEEEVQFAVPQSGQISDEQLRALLRHAQTAEDRETAYQMCIQRLIQEQQKKVREHCVEAQKAQKQNRQRTAECKASVLRKKWLIAATTTGGASALDVIRLVEPTILLVEEAAEVLESHVLACLTDSVQHLILVGDHRQLQPKVQEQAVVKKNLQVSLMERFVRLGVSPYVTLTMQRRMHPDISDFTKKFYTRKEKPGDQVVFIEDHPSTKERPVPKGVQDHKRFWFVRCNGREKENPGLRSPYNTEEAQMVVVIAQYLAMQDGVQPSNITILLPYTAQLFATFDCARERHLPTLSKKVPNGVKVCTVDGFQGEENDYIIISLVRTQKAGFLSIDNRACVSLSRARCGMYLVGCEDILREANPLWLDAVNRCTECHAIGAYFPAMCERHHTPLHFTCPRDFDAKVNRQGGCHQLCKTKLGCGHECMQECHARNFDHSETPCKLPCERLHPSCGHRCTRRCCEDCGDCEELVDFTCDHCHTTRKIPCCQLAQPPRCTQDYEGLLPCHHKTTGPCWKWTSRDPTCLKQLQQQCKEPCGQSMPCGHKCPRQCHYGNDDGHVDTASKCRYRITEPHPICQHSVEWPCNIFHLWKQQGSQATTDISFPKCNSVCGKVGACGHHCPGKCSVCAQNRGCAPCQVTVQKELPCKHSAEMPCTQEPATFMCQQVCGVKLTACEHCCGKKCCECTKELSRLPPWMVHTCQHQCGRPLPCRHECIESCSKECPPCTNLCTKTCPHHTCNERQRGRTHTCSECTFICRTNCSWSCEHHVCHKKCGEPCDRPPCNQPCSKLLPCGHPCCGYCGEDCPLFCPVCVEADPASEASKEMKAKLCNFLTIFTTTEELCQSLKQPNAREESGEENNRLVQLPCGCIFLSSELDDALRAQLSDGDGRNVVMALRCPSEACKKTIYYFPRAACVAKAWCDVREVQSRQRAALVDVTKQLDALESELRGFAADFLDEVTARDLTSRCDVANLKEIRCELQEPKPPKPPRPCASYSSGSKKKDKQQRKRMQEEYNEAQKNYKKEQELYIRQKEEYAAAKALYCNKLEEARCNQAKLFASAQQQMIKGGVQRATAEHLMHLVSRLALGAPNSAVEIRQLLLHCLLTRLCASALILRNGSSDPPVFEACLPAEKMAIEIMQLLSSGDHPDDCAEHLEAAKVQLLRATFLQRWQVVAALAPKTEQQVHALCEAQIRMILKASSSSRLFQSYDDKALRDCEKRFNTKRPSREFLQGIAVAVGLGAGHWYKCSQGHLYVIADCGGAMEESKCPECGERIGGMQHRVVATSTSAAADFEPGAQPSWPQ